MFRASDASSRRCVSREILDITAPSALASALRSSFGCEASLTDCRLLQLQLQLQLALATCGAAVCVSHPATSMESKSTSAPHFFEEEDFDFFFSSFALAKPSRSIATFESLPFDFFDEADFLSRSLSRASPDLLLLSRTAPELLAVRTSSRSHSFFRFAHLADFLSLSTTSSRTQQLAHLADFLSTSTSTSSSV